ncbi:MAG: chaperone modulator CbpM [Cyclobacteriaceae bacterium]
MNIQEFISLEVFCQHYDISPSFVISMQELGLIEIVVVDETKNIPVSQLREAEKLVRLHNDLEINIEGIDVVMQLLQRIKAMQEEILALRNSLSFYETDR